MQLVLEDQKGVKEQRHVLKYQICDIDETRIVAMHLFTKVTETYLTDILIPIVIEETSIFHLGVVHVL